MGALLVDEPILLVKLLREVLNLVLKLDVLLSQLEVLLRVPRLGVSTHLDDLVCLVLDQDDLVFKALDLVLLLSHLASEFDQLFFLPQKLKALFVVSGRRQRLLRAHRTGSPLLPLQLRDECLLLDVVFEQHLNLGLLLLAFQLQVLEDLIFLCQDSGVKAGHVLRGLDRVLLDVLGWHRVSRFNRGLVIWRELGCLDLLEHLLVQLER